MTYDWTGKRTRRMRIVRLVTAAFLLSLLVAAPVFALL